jgi:hypothetical protein
MTILIIESLNSLLLKDKHLNSLVHKIESKTIAKYLILQSLYHTLFLAKGWVGFEWYSNLLATPPPPTRFTFSSICKFSRKGLCLLCQILLYRSGSKSNLLLLVDEFHSHILFTCFRCTLNSVRRQQFFSKNGILIVPKVNTSFKSTIDLQPDKSLNNIKTLSILPGLSLRISFSTHLQLILGLIDWYNYQ